MPQRCKDSVNHKTEVEELNSEESIKPEKHNKEKHANN